MNKDKSYDELFHLLKEAKDNLDIDIQETLNCLVHNEYDDSVRELFEILSNNEEVYMTRSHV